MRKGTVKFYNAEKGYGFIVPDDGGKDVFLHVSALLHSRLQGLDVGQKGTFDVEEDKRRKGPKAVNLQIVESESRNR